MKATVQLVSECFDRFNEMCFGGKLPRPSAIVISRAKTFLGRMEYKNRIAFPSRIVGHYDYVLKISGAVDMPLELLEDVVIHEMIHYHIAFNMIKDSSPHGRVFRTLMEGINERYGRHIAVSHRTSCDASAAAKPSAWRIVCVTEFKDGNVGVTVCAKTRVFIIRRELMARYPVRSMLWYYTSDPFFGKYPRSNQGTAYRISRDDLAEHTSGAMELVCDGRSLRRK